MGTSPHWINGEWKAEQPKADDFETEERLIEHPFRRCDHKPNGGRGDCPYLAQVSACHEFTEAGACRMPPEMHRKA